MQSNRNAVFCHTRSHIDTHHADRRRPADTHAHANFGICLKVFIISITDISEKCPAETRFKLIVILGTTNGKDLSASQIAFINR